MPVGVQCPISPALGEFPSYWERLWCPGILGFRPYWCPSPFPSLSILGVFHLLLDFNLVSSLRPYRHPFGRPFTYSLFRWVSRFGTGSGTRCCSPRGDSGAHGAENSIQISALAGVEPRTLASNRVPLLLVTSYDMQELQQDNSNPEPAGYSL